MISTRERLKNFLEKMPVDAKKSLGQNFLISDHVVDKIIESVTAFNAKILIEVGPGPGALTDHLLQFNLPLHLIELDHVIAEYWRAKNCDVIETDALQMDWKKLIKENDTVLVSNLPYQISSSLVIDRSTDLFRLQAMVLMFQKEVAQRITAKEGTEDYGLLSVIAQNFWRVKKVCDAGPRDFSPAPKVASRVLSFERIESEIKDSKKFLKFAKAVFLQRRKQLKSNLTAAAGFLGDDGESVVARLNDWLVLKKHPLTIRAEELSVVEMKDLYFHYQLE